MGFAAQATFWSAVDLLSAVMPRVCEALGRPIFGLHLDVAMAQVVIGQRAGVQMEHGASTTYSQRAQKRLLI